MNTKKTTRALSILAVFGLSASHAATITWDTATTIANPTTDVSTNGTLVYAYNFGSSATSNQTLNGVNFVQKNPSGMTGRDATFTDNTLNDSYGVGLTSASTFNAVNLVLDSLSVGQDYEVQVWSNDGRSTVDPGTARFTTFTSGNSVALNQGNGGENGGLGQYSIGYFTASEETQTISLTTTGSNTGVVNLMQLRAIPEPNAFGLVAIAGIAAVFMRRRSRKA